MKSNKKASKEQSNDAAYDLREFSEWIVLAQIKEQFPDPLNIFRTKATVTIVWTLPENRDTTMLVLKRIAKSMLAGRPDDLPYELDPSDAGNAVFTAASPEDPDGRDLFHTRAAIRSGKPMFVFATTDQTVCDEIRIAHDREIIFDDFNADHVRAAIESFYGPGRVSGNDAELLAEYPLDTLSLACRHGRPLGQAVAALHSFGLDKIEERKRLAEKKRKEEEDSVEAARRRRKGKNQYAAEYPKDGPRVADLHGYGDELQEWSADLVADINDWIAGKIEWSDVDNGVLLSGPPGTGKTTFATALARSCGARIIYASVARWQSHGHMGDMLKAMRAAFDNAAAASPCVLLIDELDSIGLRDADHGHSSQYVREVANGLLECLDGAEQHEGVVVVGTTNEPANIDPGIRRPGRLDRHIVIPLPDAEARAEILRYHLQGAGDGVSLSFVAERMRGMSGAAIEQVAKQAKRIARRQKRGLIYGDLTSQLPAEIRFSGKLLRTTSIHEAGHAAAALELGMGDDIVEGFLAKTNQDVVNGAAGFIEYRPSEVMKTKQDYEFLVIRVLAGTAAEEVMLGTRTDGAGGSDDSDLAYATRILVGMQVSLGFGGSLIHLATNDPSDLQLTLRTSPALRDAVEARMREFYQRAVEICQENKVFIEQMSRLLRMRGRVSGDDIRALYEKNLEREATALEPKRMLK